VRWLEAANLVDLEEDLNGKILKDLLEEPEQEAGEEFPRAA
jgi:hypothetical protein